MVLEWGYDGNPIWHLNLGNHLWIKHPRLQRVLSTLLLQKPCNITRLRMSLDIADIGPLAVVMQKLSISMGIMPFKTTSLLDKPKEQRRSVKSTSRSCSLWKKPWFFTFFSAFFLVCCRVTPQELPSFAADLGFGSKREGRSLPHGGRSPCQS